MRYISTRGRDSSRSFKQTAIEGLARDGGLFVPEIIPDFSNQLMELSKLSYQDLALRIFEPFVKDELSHEVLERLVQKSYQSFARPEITPLIHTESVSLLELFHGPTLAFKDIALQFLGNLFEKILEDEDSTLNILGATSGDTGSAAIYGVKGKNRIHIFILHPKGRVSPIQEKQMTTIMDSNVHNIAIEGNFDDAQKVVKDLFNNLEFKDKFHLGAINSINWVRVMAQIVYYFYAGFRFFEQHKRGSLVFSVPTGNFGDIYAGYLAKKMGLPIEKLIMAVNENDILYQTLRNGKYKIGNVHKTLSPSMDIQVSSNFERFLFDLLDRNGNAVQEKMDSLKTSGEFELSQDVLDKASHFIEAQRIDMEEMLACMKKFDSQGITLDPHTAVGVAAAEKSSYSNVVCLATAHPAKFSEAVEQGTGKSPKIPQSLQGILEKKSKCLECSADPIEIMNLIQSILSS